MKLSYLPVRFHIVFDPPAYADNPPLFVLRSMLGKLLRSMCCIAHNSKCQECLYNKNCVYTFLFETILPSENNITPGRDRASHPFVFTSGTLRAGKEISEYDFTITLLGKAIDYLPYVYTAFVHAGKEGVFKSRTPFIVDKVEADKKNILLDADHLDTSAVPKTWSFNENLSDKTGEILVELRTPMRFKYDGNYGTDFSVQDFFACLYRRTKTLCRLYGNYEAASDYTPSDAVKILESHLEWQDYRHYSVRQKEAMILGGTVGTLKLAGSFSAMDQNLLEFGRVFNVGKNTNFGLGQLDFWQRWE